MKALLTITALLLFVGSYAQGKLEVVVTNIKSANGSIRVGLFNNEKDFLEKPIAGKVVRASGSEVIVSFEGLTKGEYAVSVYHDENSNEELDTNFVGIPREGFAFGNNAMGTFGPPSFEKAKVRVEDKTVQQKVALKYF
jgi:uncharacterized protein (DUF2141 family)